MSRKNSELVATAVREATREAARELELMRKQQVDPIEAERIKTETAHAREQKRRSRVTWLLRKHLYPWKAAGVALAAGAVTWLAGFFAAGVAAVLGLILALVLLGAAWRWSTKAGKWAARVRVGGGVAAAWLMFAALTGPSWLALFLLVLSVVCTSAGYWRANPIGKWSKAREVAAAQIASIPARWTAYIADKGGVLADSKLSGQEMEDTLVRYDVQLRPGRQTLSTALAGLPLIASGLDVPVRNLVLEPHPSESPSRVRLTIVTRSPIADTVEFAGPRVNGGIIYLGPYGDGQGSAPWRIWTPGEVVNGGSAWGGFILGGMGVGKSRTMELLCIGAMSTGAVETWFIDPQGGASSPGLRNSADWFVDLDEAGDMLEALEGLVTARGKEMSHQGHIGYDLAADRPLLHVVIDECHEVFNLGDDAERWETVVRKARKVGVATTALSQYGGLDTFGGRDALRSSLFAGNVAVMRSESKQNAGFVPGLDLDPISLPELPGFGYTVKRGGFDARTAPYRAEYVADPSYWLQKYPGPGLDAVAASGAGDRYRRRRELDQQKRDQLRESIDLLMSGKKADMVGPRKAPATSGAGTWFGAGGFGAATPNAGGLRLLQGGAAEATGASEVNGAPAATDAGPGTCSAVAATATPSQPVEAAQARTAVPTTREAILAHLAAHETASKGELIKAANASESGVRQVLDKLMESGDVERVGRGLYRLGR